MINKIVVGLAMVGMIAIGLSVVDTINDCVKGYNAVDAYVLNGVLYGEQVTGTIDGHLVFAQTHTSIIETLDRMWYYMND